MFAWLLLLLLRLAVAGPILVADQCATALKGMADVAPGSSDFAYYRVEIDKLTAFHQFPRVDPKDLRQTETAHMGGMGNKHMIVAELGGEKVIVKVTEPLNRDPAMVLQEMRRFLLLNKMGLGPELKGMVVLDSGDVGIVTTFVPGITWPLRRNETIPPGFEVKATAVEDIRRAGEKLRDAGFAYAPDIQFRITPEGRAVLIDPEFFEYSVPANPRFNLPYDPIWNTRVLAKQLEAEVGKKRERFQGLILPH